MVSRAVDCSKVTVPVSEMVGDILWKGNGLIFNGWRVQTVAGTGGRNALRRVADVMDGRNALWREGVENGVT